MDFMTKFIFLAEFCLFYDVTLGPLVHYGLINKKIEKKIGRKIYSNRQYPFNSFYYKWGDRYLGVPIVVSYYITIKFLLKILGLNSDKIKAGRSTLQEINYSVDNFSPLEIIISVWHFFTFGVFIVFCIAMIIVGKIKFTLFGIKTV